MIKSILSKLKLLFYNGDNKQSSKQYLPPETDSENGHLCMINYHFEDDDYDDMLTVVTSREPTIGEAVRLIERRNKALMDIGVRTGKIIVTNIYYSEEGEL